MRLGCLFDKCVAGIVACCVTAYAQAEQPEPILGFRTIDNQIIFQVPSHGCTTKSSFDVHVTGLPPNAKEVTITLVRTKPDECKGFFRDGTEIVFTRQELGLTSNVTVHPANLEASSPK
jgi:hypothetical protein